MSPWIVLAQSAADTVNTILPDTTIQNSSSIYFEKLFSTIIETKPELSWSTTFGKLLWCIGIVTLAFLFLKYLIRPLEVISKRSRSKSKYINKLIPTIRISFWALISYVLIVGIISPQGEIFLILLAIIGITIGFSMQDFFKNILGGIVILLERPFQVGDKIEIDGYYGEIKHIGLRSMRILSSDTSVIIIPNSEVLKKSVTNRNAGAVICQVSTDFYLPLDVDIEAAKKVAHRAASVSQYIYLNKPITVTAKNEVYSGHSMIRLCLSATVLDLRYESLFASEMTEILMDEFKKIGITNPDAGLY
jgi:small-conductance mechanosensitive channel